MKSIIIIIALFLGTLTVKADWVKTGELDSLYLGDAPITFSKYSPDYTKFVTYSAQDSTLRLWDLGTGKVIKERTFDWSYKFDVCEFDFESEMFYMVKNGKIYPGSKGFDGTMSHDPNNILWYINFYSNLQYKIIIANGSFAYGGKYPTVETTIYYCKMIVINKKYVSLYYEVILNTRWNVSSGNETSGNAYYFKAVSVNKNDNKLLIHPTTNFSINKYYKYNNGTALSYIIKGNTNYFMFNYIDTLKYYRQFENISLNNDSPNYNKILNIHDINYNTLVYNHSGGEAEFYDLELEKPLNFKLPISIEQTRNLKLMVNNKTSVFYLKNENKVLITNNEAGLIIDSVDIKYGEIGIDNTLKTIYSFSGNSIVKKNITTIIAGFANVWTDKKRYLIGTDLKLNLIMPKVTSLKIVIDDKYSYYGSAPTLNNLGLGFHNVKVYYTENGIKRVLSKDSVFKVEDSIRISYTITNPNNNIAKYPFTFSLNTNYEDCKCNWTYFYTYYPNINGKNLQIKSQVISANSASFYISQIGDSTGVKLKCSNEHQDTTIQVKFGVKPYLNASFNFYRGVAPLKLKIFFENTFISFNGIFDSTFANYYSYKEYKIGNIIKKRSSGFNSDTTDEIITEPGIYKVVLSTPSHMGDFALIHDSVITVLAPTDIQDFAERKYIFKQDAEGFYCQLEGEGEVTLYDNVGRLVRTYQIENERYIRKEDLERGVYFLSIQTGGNVYHEKVLVE